MSRLIGGQLMPHGAMTTQIYPGNILWSFAIALVFLMAAVGAQHCWSARGHLQLGNLAWKKGIPCHMSIGHSCTKYTQCILRSELFNSLWPSDAIWRQGSRSTLVQVMAWCRQPLPEPILTDHQWSPVAFILGQFRKRCLNHILNFIQISQGPMSWCIETWT